MTQTQIAWYRQNQLRQSMLHAMYMQIFAPATGGNSQQPTPPIPPMNDKLKLVVETTVDYKKTGIYSAERDDASKPIIIDWGDGTVEQIDGDISQLVHEYASAETFNVVVQNIKSYVASDKNFDWTQTTSQNHYTLKEIVAIPDAIKSIGDYAFSGCSDLTSVTIPDSVTSIGQRAFYNCHGITNLTIPDSVTSIGDNAFNDCSGITNLTIGTGVTSIGNYVFYGCSSLTSVTIPDSVTSIGGWAFHSCTSLTNVTIPGSVTNIMEYAFYDCRELTSVTIPNSVTNIGNFTFGQCGKLKSVYITDIVKWCNICGGKAFDQAYNLYLNDEKITTLTIPSNVIDISAETFKYCGSLENVTILDGVTSIGNYAFSRCTGLTSVTIPASTTSIGYYAFSDCNGLMSFTVDDGNANYKSVNGLLLSKDGKTLIKGVNGEVTIPDGVTSISDYAFQYYGGLTSVTIPNSVENIGEAAFKMCRDLENLVFTGNHIPAGGAHCFYDITNLTDIYMLNVSQDEVMSQLDNNINNWGLGIDWSNGKRTYAVTIHCKDGGEVVIEPLPSGSGS